MAIPEYAVGPIRNLYLALPQGTNPAPTRFSATTGDDDVNLGPQTLIRGATFLVIFAMTLPPQRFLALSRTMIRRSPLFPRLLSVQLHRPSPHPHHPVSTSLTTVPPFDNSHPIRQTTESFRDPVTPPDQATARAMRDTVTSGIVAPLPTPETSTSAPPLLTSTTTSVSA